MSKKTKLSKLAQTRVPRSLDEIRKEYAQITGQYANSQYQSALYAQESSRLFDLMKGLNLEAEERNRLDAAQKPVEAAPEVADASE